MTTTRVFNPKSGVISLLPKGDLTVGYFMNSVTFSQNSISENFQIPGTKLLQRRHYDSFHPGSIGDQSGVLQKTQESSHFHILYRFFPAGGYVRLLRFSVLIKRAFSTGNLVGYKSGFHAVRIYCL